jgi:hypothetical protein
LTTSFRIVWICKVSQRFRQGIHIHVKKSSNFRKNYGPSFPR